MREYAGGDAGGRGNKLFPEVSVMKELAILCKDAGIICPAGIENIRIRCVVSDSRKVEKDCLFVAIRGLHRNGEDHIEEALEKGAAVVVSEHVPEHCKDRCIPVTDARAALACLFDAWYGMPSRKLKMIGVTGTNGKTTVSCMLNAILTSAGYQVGRIGTLGAFSRGVLLPQMCDDELANLTTPDPSDLYRILAVMAEDGCEYVVMEASSHSLALGKVAPIQFDTAIFTNLTQEHLDFHKTMEGYLEAKQKLFRNCRTAIINNSDPYAEQIQSVCPGKVVTCGEKSDYRATNPDASDFRGVSYTLTTPSESIEILCPVPGSFMVMNSMQAVACATELGIPLETTRNALASFRSVPGRMESVLPDSAKIKVIIDYAHTPDALEKLLRTAREMCRGGEGRLTVLFGCGGDRDPSKRKEMGTIASRFADFVIVTSDNSRSEDPVEIIRQILRGVNREKEHVAITSRHEAIRYAVENAGDGDMIVLAGKGHETYEIDRTGRHAFDERAEVQKAYRNRK